MDLAEQVALAEDHPAGFRPQTLAEVWKPVPGLEGHYSVSSLGRIRVEARTLQRRSGQHTRQQRVLRPAVGKKGYLSLQLGLGPETRRTHYVHCLVLEAFVGPRPEGMDACHRDGRRSNNALANLRWDTRAANHADKVEHGTATVGERHPQAKLTETDVLQIRSERAAGKTFRALAAQFNVTPATVQRAVNGTNWSHL